MSTDRQSTCPTARAARRGRDLRHDAARRRPARGHLAHRRRQAAHRRAARLARRRTASRAAGPAPTRRTRSSSARAAPSSSSTTSTLVAFGSTRRVKGKVDDDPTLRQPGRGRARRRCASSASAGTTTSPRRCGPTLDEGVAMVADSVEFLQRRGPAGDVRRRALLRRLQAQPRVRAAGARGGGRARAPTASCCATPTAARCLRGRAASSARSSRYFGDDVVVGDPPARRHRLRRGQRARRRAGRRHARCRARSTATASAPATATSSTIIPNLTLKMGVAHAARGPPRAAHRRSATTSPSW